MRTGFRKFGIWFVTIVLLFVTCLLPYFSQNALAVTAGDVLVYMDNAAKVQTVAHAFKQCVNLQYKVGVNGKFYFGDVISGNLFADGGINQSNTDIYTGAWLEKTVQGKVDDGSIWCKNDSSNIVNVFASTMGVSWKDLVCNGSNPGMMTLQVNTLVNPDKNIYQWKNTDSACDVGFGSKDYRFAWRSDAEVLAYVKSIYENYKSANPEVADYLPAWDDVSNFSDGGVLYFYYLNDFKAACTNGSTYTGDMSLMNQANYFPAIKEVNPNTGVLEEVYYARSVAKDNWKNSVFGSSGAHTCDTVIDKINGYADAAAQKAGAVVAEAVKEAEEAAKERSKERCKALALYASVEFDNDGNITKKIDFGGEPSAAYYYLKAKKIVDDPDATRADIVKQLRETLVANNPGLSDDEINAKIDEQKSQIDDTLDALLTRAQSIYDKFDKVLTGAGTGTGDGNPETSYWYEKSNGEIFCTEFESFDDTITNESGYQDILDSLLSGATTSTNPQPTTPTGGDIDECQGVAGSLGWILCPVLKIIGNAAEGIYEKYVEKDFLEVNSEWFQTTNDVYTKGWRLFRNYANITFAILLFLVIISQLTGFGISNYGIKKMLPRLIMIAVLINLSFVICQFFVDISNILGYGLNRLFLNMGSSINPGAATSGVLGRNLGVAELLAAAFVVGSYGSWLIPALLGLLSCLFSVLVCALILGVRQAGVVILVVISPLAIACYAIDGTKTFFDKWKKLFVGLLVVFPVCGAMIGGGTFASSLLLSGSTGFFITLIAMLLRIVPLLFIPSIVKSSLAAMGNLGAKISSFGSGLNRWGANKARNSSLYRHADATVGRSNGKLLQWSAKKIGKAYHRIPGADKFATSRVGKRLGRIGNFLASGTRRRIAGYASKDSALVYEDAKSGAAEFMDRDAREAVFAQAREQREKQGIEEQTDFYQNDKDFDTHDEKNLRRTLDELRAAAEKDPDNVTIRRKIKAITKFMLEFDEGRGELTQAFHAQSAANPGSQVTKMLNDFLNKGENVRAIKSSGQLALMANMKAVTNGESIKSLAHYVAEGAKKLNANSAARIDDSALKALADVAGTGVMQSMNMDDSDPSKGTVMQHISDLYTQVMNSDETTNEVKAKMMPNINRILNAGGKSDRKLGEERVFKVHF